MQINIMKNNYCGTWIDRYDLTNSTWLQIKNTFCDYMWFTDSVIKLAKFIKNEKEKQAIAK